MEEVLEGGALVLFTDYGNFEQAAWDQLVRGAAELPREAAPDLYVAPFSPVHSAPEVKPEVKLLSLLGLVAEEALTLAVRALVYLALAGPDLLVVCRGEAPAREGAVLLYSREGVLGGRLLPARPFVDPSDILTLRSGQVAVRNAGGIQLLGADGQFLRRLGRETDSCHGLTEDGEGRLVTININESSRTSVTEPGETDVFRRPL